MSNDENIRAISEWLEEVHFEKQYIGGVREQDVWNKIMELNKMYEEAFLTEKIQHETLIKWMGKLAKDNQTEEIGYDE